MIVLDTNVVSEFIKPAPDRNVEAWLDSFPTEAFFLSTPVIAELEYGSARLPQGRRKQALEETFDRLENEIFLGRILVFDYAAARRFGPFRADREKRGRAFAPMDIAIAAIAAAHSMTVATRNNYDFEGLGVSLVNPFEPR
jgi:predicted nucleic acid-binding protein